MLRIREDATVKTTDSSEILMPGVTQKKIAREWLVPKSDVAHIPCVSIVYTSTMYNFPAGKGQLELQEFDDREEICGRILERAINNPPSTNHHHQVIYNPYHYIYS